MAPPTKPPSTPQSNTLFNYFKTTPKAQTGTPSQSQTPSEDTPRKRKPEDEEEASTLTPTTKATKTYSGAGKKGRRILDEEGLDPQKNGTPKVAHSNGNGHGNGKKRRASSSSKEGVTASEEEEDNVKIAPKNKKRKRIQVIDDDSEDEYKPKDGSESSEESDVEMESEVDDASSGQEESGSDVVEDSPKNKKGKGKNRKNGSSKPQTPKDSAGLKTPNAAVKARLGQFSKANGDDSPANSRPGTPGLAVPGKGRVIDEDSSSPGGPTLWPHLTLDFLKPDKIRDINGNKPSDPNYDPTTLRIPKDFLEKQTPGLRQWWELKARNFDTILFFKMGKFYEFYNMDAVLAVEELNMIYMKGENAHAGFPESAYAKWSTMMVEKGYKIARIEQVETPDMMKERMKKTRGADGDKNVVRRVVCQVTTRGVRTASFQDDPYNSPFTPESRYLYAIYEKTDSSGKSTFGVCFIDTTIGEFQVGQFEDDRYFSRLRTLFSHFPPAQVLISKGNVNPQVDQLLGTFAGVRKDILPVSSFSTHDVVLRKLREGTFFYDEANGGHVWPQVFDILTTEGKTSISEGWDLGIQALGGVMSYLDSCLILHDMLSMRKFLLYTPVDAPTVVIDAEPSDRPTAAHMVLDAVTLQNLDIVESTNPGWNLFSLVDKCCTPFGKRLLREWMCMPLAIPRDIDSRLDAIDDIQKFDDFLDTIIPLMKSLPDLERLLNKVHLLGSSDRRINHPESKAIFFEEKKYSRNKIVDLLSVLKGFKTCTKIITCLKENHPESIFLSDIVQNFPDLDKLLHHFETAFDHASAAKEGKIIPKPGVDSEYDEIVDTLEDNESECLDYLKEIGRKLGCNVKYFGTDKKRFQLEVPDGTKVPHNYELSSSRKGFKRYTNLETKRLLENTQRLEAKREEVLKDITRRIFEKFDKSHETWKAAVDCIAKLDAIMSLTNYSTTQVDMCRPKVTFSDRPFVKIRDGRHPYMPVDVYIANSCYLGVARETLPDYGNFVLLTGPNMGGKSTLMRQVALITILAHMGCYVPAAFCEMSVVDRIFTRLGAADNIGEGESTFFVELSETSSVLRHCSKHSLVLMDELGRGTATYDGTAIAYAVATKLANQGIRTLFSTHYHTLVEAIQHLPAVQLGHMSCMVENENEEDPTQETITFLYKIAPGPCPKSYGFNAASLAGLPDTVIRTAHQKAKEFETSCNSVDAFRKIIGLEGLSLKRAMKLLKI